MASPPTFVAAIGATKPSARKQIDALGPGTEDVPNMGDILTWNGSAWEPVPGGGGEGITQLTGDVTAGPGIGSQAATVLGLDGRPLDSAAPNIGDLLIWDGTKWTYQAAGSFASGTATRILHTFVIGPERGSSIPGHGADPVVYGTTMGLHFQKDDDLIYTVNKIQTSYVSDPSFHVHWTKSSDTNQSGRTVRWVLNYTVFNGNSHNINVAPTGTAIWNSTYNDAGTTNRIVYRTINVAAVGFVAGSYVSVALGFDPAGTTLTNRPVVISVDMLTRNTINEGD